MKRKYQIRLYKSTKLTAHYWDGKTFDEHGRPIAVCGRRGLYPRKLIPEEGYNFCKSCNKKAEKDGRKPTSSKSRRGRQSKSS